MDRVGRPTCNDGLPVQLSDFYIFKSLTLNWITVGLLFFSVLCSHWKTQLKILHRISKCTFVSFDLCGAFSVRFLMFGVWFGSMFLCFPWKLMALLQRFLSKNFPFRWECFLVTKNFLKILGLPHTYMVVCRICWRRRFDTMMMGT